MEISEATEPLDCLSADDLQSQAARMKDEARTLYQELVALHNQVAFDFANPLVPYINHLAKPVHLQSEEELRSLLRNLGPLLAPAREHLRKQSTVELANDGDLQRLRKAFARS